MHDSTGDGDDLAPLGESVAAGDSTRARLVQVAVRVLQEGGEQAVKVREIASALGVSIGAVYHHFQSREDLIVAARIEQFRGVLSQDVAAIRDLVNRVRTVGELRDGMREITRMAHGPARAPFRRLRAEVAGVATHNEHLAEVLSQVQEQCTAEMAELIEITQRKGFGNPALDPRAVATLMQATALGLVIDDVNMEHPVDPEAWLALIDALYETLLVA